MATPTLIGMPGPPSNPDTPTEAPGTPNSTTTSLSALSTTAIKDGHRGAALPHERGHHHTPSSNTLEAERADRISRLAGLERVSTARPSNPNSAGAGPSTNQGQIPGYFDQHGNPVYTTKISTVGSASATGSVGGRTTTWASGSQRAEGQEDDEMSMDTNFRDIDERDRYSTSAIDQDEAMDQDGMSDDASLVGFGEGAGSTVSGPIYSRRDAGVVSPVLGRTGSSLAAQVQSSGSGMPVTVDRERRDARMADGWADDGPGYLDTATRGGRGTGSETAERIMRERFEENSEGRNRPMGTPDEAGLGKFYFEERK